MSAQLSIGGCLIKGKLGRIFGKIPLSLGRRSRQSKGTNMIEYTFSISTTIAATNEEEAEAILHDMISIPSDFVVSITDKYDPDSDTSYHYSDYYGWEEV